MIVLRTQNAAALVTGRWAEWSLLPEGDSTRLRTPNYFPFLAAKHMSPASAKALQTAWFAVLVVALVANVRLLFRLTGAFRAELTTTKRKVEEI